jgi:hypothetical protein
MEKRGRDVSDMTIDELKEALIEQNEKANFLIDQFHKAADLNKKLWVEDLKTMYVMVKTQHDDGYTDKTQSYNEDIEAMMSLLTDLIIIEE